ncbi:hypothetical protein N7468_009949 [Penicillium chermesinum]|uniref:Uncharacterized protein n=1 Tax=Penicillium chermesinum TaxID=63820 RepID=A0A9W9NBQ8_9EURO|nr:uncharacterized protein N7468_009949 [Penicillium chermesinum]KAJ5216941.1 hypothetical protein N7468_009949 [Penicillium chermesinum]KAJ6171446.1 hypothetical protein N7470_000513 [Penicillium chermesinum]
MDGEVRENTTDDMSWAAAEIGFGAREGRLDPGQGEGTLDAAGMEYSTSDKLHGRMSSKLGKHNHVFNPPNAYPEIACGWKKASEKAHGLCSLSSIQNYGKRDK